MAQKENKELFSCSKTNLHLVIHQFAQDGFPEEPPENEYSMLIYTKFSDSAGLKRATFSAFPLL
jgi:hypothetical protein